MNRYIFTIKVLNELVIQENEKSFNLFDEIREKEANNTFKAFTLMKDAIEKYVDLRGAAAFQEADLDYKDLKKEYKKMKKDADEVDDMEKALKAYAKESEDSDLSVSVSKIGKPKQNSKNKKIYTVSATMSLKSSYGSISDQSVRFVFYKGKIIDILSKGYGDDSSMFKNALDSNK